MFIVGIQPGRLGQCFEALAASGEAYRLAYDAHGGCLTSVRIEKKTSKGF